MKYRGPTFMQRVLILGNGLSRLNFDKEIREWTGLLWGCNRAYLDYGKELDGLAGHSEVMNEARRYRDEHNLKYEIIESLTCRPLFQKDTGTTLVAEALTRGMEVEVVGFDIGGLDVYSPGHEKKNKTSWVNRWRLILREFGEDSVKFWGYDHRPFLLSLRHPSEYAHRYMNGEAHIDDDEYEKTVEEWDNDYSKVYDALPKAMLKNIGNREYRIAEIDGLLKSGESVTVLECVAEKYLELYPRDFALQKLSSGSIVSQEA